MANQVTTRSTRPASRSGRPLTPIQASRTHPGRDWKVALPFVLPLIVLMVGLIFWPFINAILISFTTRSIARKEVWVGLGQLRTIADR